MALLIRTRRLGAAALVAAGVALFAVPAEAAERVCAPPEISHTAVLRSGVPKIPGYRARLAAFGIRVPRSVDAARPCRLPGVSFATNSWNWNGYEGQSPAGSLTSAVAEVKVPELDDAACENDSVGDWVGVGGPGGAPTLIQTGLFHINDCSWTSSRSTT